MPYYLTRGRRDPNSQQRDNTERLRDAASQFTPMIFSQRDSWIIALFWEYLHIVVANVFHLANGIKAIYTSTDKSSKTIYTKGHSTSNFPFNNPGLAVLFKKPVNHLPATIRKEFEELGFTLGKGTFGGKSVQVYRISTYNEDVAVLCEKYRTEIDDSYTRTSYNHIVPAHIPIFEVYAIQLANIFTTVYNVFDKPNKTDDIALTMTSGEWNPVSIDNLHRDGIHKESPTNPTTASASTEKEKMDTDAQSGWKQWIRPFGYVRLALAPSVTTLTRCWGPLNDCPFNSGFSMPFVRSYSTRDVNAMDHLFTSYPRMFLRPVSIGGSADKQVEMLVKGWKQTISNSDIGQELAHMAKVLDVCRLGKTRAYFAFNGSMYLGAVIEGDYVTVITETGLQIRGTSDPIVFAAEIAAVDRHAAALKSILSIGKCTFSGPITSMRQLSVLIQVKNIDGAQESKIRELLKEVDFNEQPVPLTPDALDELYEFLLSEKSLPNSLYLSRVDFFIKHSSERVLSALAMFGDLKPTFKTGTSLRPLLESDGTAKHPFVATPPKVLQLDRTRDAKGAEQDWKDLMNTRILCGEWEKRKDKTIVYDAVTKPIVWAGLSAFAAKLKGNTGDHSVGDKRKGDDLSKEDGGKKNKDDREVIDVDFDDLF